MSDSFSAGAETGQIIGSPIFLNKVDICILYYIIISKITRFVSIDKLFNIFFK